MIAPDGQWDEFEPQDPNQLIGARDPDAPNIDEWTTPPQVPGPPPAPDLPTPNTPTEPVNPNPAGGGGGSSAGYDVLGGYQNALAKIRGSIGGSERAVLMDKLARDIYSNLAGAGHDVKWSGDQLIVDGRPYMLAEGNYMPSGEAAYQAPTDINTNDIPEFSYEQLMQSFASPEEDAAVAKLMANPYSMSELDVARLKAKSKDELAEMDLQNRDQMQTLASSYGFQESPWLASEELGSRRATDQALVGSNRNIDLTAAQTRKADELRAIDVAGKHAAGKRDKSAQASSMVLSAAAAKGDRLALREAVKQEASRQGLAAEQILADHVHQALDRDMKMKISSQELAHADTQHLEELAMNLAQLEQFGQQFGATNSLAQQRLAQEANQWDAEHEED